MHETSSTGQAAKDRLVSFVAGHVYRVPLIGLAFRRFLERHLGRRFYQNRDFFNQILSSWASPWLGGTLSVDLRNSITLHLAKRLAPKATSVLDLGCAGGTLALHLGPEFETYWGVDISDVAIAKAKENLAAASTAGVQYHLEVSPIEEFQPSRKFDVIVFNEVLHYLSLDQVAAAIQHYAGFLADNGLIVLSLKNGDLSSLIESVVLRELKFECGVLYQQQPQRPGWKTVQNRETPAYLVQAFRV